MDKIEPILLNVKQVSQLLNISVRYVYILHTHKKFPSPIKLGRRNLWHKESLEMWVRLNCPDQKVAEKMLNQARNKIQSKRVKELSDHYIKQLLCSNSSLSRKDIPQEVIETKREHLKLTRKLRKVL